jgi:hypothetical protein
LIMLLAIAGWTALINRMVWWDGNFKD